MRYIGINVNTNKDVKGELLNKIVNKIKNSYKDVEIRVYKDSIGLENEETKDLEVAIVLGGDGTILKAAKHLVKYNVPILGVNIGNLGFLTEIESSNFIFAIESYFENKYYIEERNMVQCTIEYKGDRKDFYGLNDVVVTKGTIGKTGKYDLYIDGNFYTKLNSDGVIVSTPTGSTAYSLSAGGPIIYPTMDALCLTPVCGHSLRIRSIVLNHKSIIKIIPQSENVNLTVDGEEINFLQNTKEFLITSSPYKCKLIKLKGEHRDYYSILRNKLYL
ncbi:NAD(+)/NADH kinase [Clostridium cochlearium]|uniref:NAD kinase n=1 Tax=Clostridium cochlearium TaxID=1494 RepID=A0A1G9H5G7_CLOCO|nr:NAD(+)/NADH kinase [Clostridium cochlearium]MBV1816984.1 NAD(+)/NADH kinase [Bacteroidales bacterium MSK.15.36]NSJ90760.1 NAD(+)/NADH kinase [Coprococcus sp. MSK.21.13]MCG4570736.1 NAD(+)/NADH kinase [Clostridium cochlearium]MCG4579553.1 NAD(+)/NADH kinase [Clostridium cochlearium]MCR1970434.1 NAD(+)/NADH kinase [Clostridium cochlearium]